MPGPFGEHLPVLRSAPTRRARGEEREKLGIQSLPADLGEAILEAENSELLYKALGEHVFTRLLELKRAEFEDYRVQVTPYEIQKYLPIL